MKDLKDYKGILPYASELFGIYQPLLGWKSRIILNRYNRFRASIYNVLADKSLVAMHPSVSVRIPNDPQPDPEHVNKPITEFMVKRLEPTRFTQELQPYPASSIDSAVTRLLRTEIGTKVPKDWTELVGNNEIGKLLERVQTIITNPELLEQNPEIAEYLKSFLRKTPNRENTQAALQSFFRRESCISGYLLFLAKNYPAGLTPLFFKPPKVDLVNLLQFQDPLLNFGLANYEAILSPIGVIHLFREYFFEFDSFLGPAVGHIWLSPGGTVELIEINTRKVFTERTLEMATEITQRSESQVTNQDELSDAVKDENSSNTKLGFSNVAKYSSGTFEDTATASFSLDNSKKNARESTHKQMRQQSEKLSSEIKRSFKTTFKTSTEVTDTSSKRYVLQNTTANLVNYELRRKMRKVGVQVQDIGTQMCWHTFVDDPGRELGIAKLVHIATPPELGDLPQPDQLPIPSAKTAEVNITIPFTGIGGNDDKDETYTNGVEADAGGELGDASLIKADFPQTVTCDLPEYTLKSVQLESQNDCLASVHNQNFPDAASVGSFTVHLDNVNFREQDNVQVKATLHWEPSKDLIDSINAENQSRIKVYTAEKERRFKEAFYNAARERIKLASKIDPRTAEELREEERTVIYRKLISQLMQVGYDGTDQTNHVISELVRSIFDVDKMLYFVAPEWWIPRRHRSGQDLGGDPSQIPETDIVDWGGVKEFGRDNYYITEDSTPAKLGSSLGWLLQLDGDNLRNAMLNSAWVKAVIPIRVGKEKEAINWLQQAHVEGSDGLDAQYQAAPDDPPELQKPGLTIRQALDFLIDKIKKFNEIERKAIEPNPADPESPQNHFAGSLPTEAVFEHGFYPLQGGIKFDGEGTEQAIFSQWMEILPTDQVVALEVEYDPKTLQIKEPK